MTKWKGLIVASAGLVVGLLGYLVARFWHFEAGVVTGMAGGVLAIIGLFLQGYWLAKNVPPGAALDIVYPNRKRRRKADLAETAGDELRKGSH